VFGLLFQNKSKKLYIIFTFLPTTDGIKPPSNNNTLMFSFQDTQYTISVLSFASSISGHLQTVFKFMGNSLEFNIVLFHNIFLKTKIECVNIMRLF